MALLWTSSAFGQKVAFRIDSAPLKDVISQVEKQTRMKVDYDGVEVNVYTQVSTRKLKGDIHKVLPKILFGSGYEAEFSGDHIIIKRSKQQQTSPRKDGKGSPKRKITGKITDENGEPIIGATVREKGTSYGTVTDEKGNYSLEVSSDALVEVSYIGYKTQTFKGNEAANIKLHEDTEGLDEIVVVGYGVQKKMDLSSSIVSLSTKNLGEMPNGLEAGLQSLAPGVQVTNGRIRIRGVGTINDTDPVYVVDGMIGGAMPNENNIESIQILKDAASCAIYGARGANGVILITTKRGTAGKVGVEYNGYVGTRQLQHSIDLLNGQELAELVNEEMYNADPSRTDYLKALSDPVSIGEGYNMFNALKRTAFIQNHNVSLNGGNENARFRVNGNIGTDQPTFIKEDNKNFGIQFISDFKLGKLKIGETMMVKRVKKNWSNKNIIESLQWSPTLSFYDPTNPTGFMGASNGTNCGNPLASANLTWNKAETTLVNGNVWGIYEFIPGLSYKLNIGVDYSNSMTQKYDGDYVITYMTHSPDQYDIQSVKSNRLLIENTLSYDKTFGKHNISALAGVTSERTNSLGVNAGVRALASPSVLSLGTTRDNDSRTVGSSEYKSAMYSLLARINYSYDSKYMLTANFRRDGSSNFSKKNRYGNFPSFSAAWRMSKENFMKDIKFIDDLKIRGSWGILGNSNISPYQYQSTVSFSKICYYLNDTRVTGGFPVVPSNPDVKWENQYSTDLGLDAIMFNGHLNLVLDYYYKKTEDMLVQVPISFAAGFMNNSPVLNAGSIENKGFEIALTYRNSYKNLDYSLTANLSTVKNKVLELGAKNEIFAMNEISKTVVGKPIGMFWGYVTDGLYTTQEQLDADKSFAPKAALGDVRFKNLNGDNVLNAEDQDFIGNPIPDFSYGFSTDLSYTFNAGKLDFSMIWQGTYGNDIYNNSRHYGEGMFGYTNCFASTLDRYRAEELVFTNPVSGIKTIYPKNTDTDMPRAVMGDPNQNTRKSDRYVEDGSYLRLKSLVVSYTLPSRWTQRWNIERLKFFVGGRNLLTITGYSGFDPEVGDQNTGNNLTRGIDASSTWGTTFPNVREYYMGIQLYF